MAYVFNSVKRMGRPDRGVGETLQKNVGADSTASGAQGVSNTATAQKPEQFTQASPLQGAAQAIFKQNQNSNTGVGQAYKSAGQREFGQKQTALTNNADAYKKRYDTGTMQSFNDDWLADVNTNKEKIAGVLAQESGDVEAFNPGVSTGSDNLGALRQGNLAQDLMGRRAGGRQYTGRMAGIDNALFRRATPERMDATNTLQGLQTNLGNKMQELTAGENGLETTLQKTRDDFAKTQREGTEGKLRGLEAGVLSGANERAATLRSGYEAKKNEEKLKAVAKIKAQQAAKEAQIREALKRNGVHDPKVEKTHNKYFGQSARLPNSIKDPAINALSTDLDQLKMLNPDDYIESTSQTDEDFLSQSLSEGDATTLNSIAELLKGKGGYVSKAPVAGPEVKFRSDKLAEKLGGIGGKSIADMEHAEKLDGIAKAEEKQRKAFEYEHAKGVQGTGTTPIFEKDPYSDSQAIYEASKSLTPQQREEDKRTRQFHGSNFGTHAYMKLTPEQRRAYDQQRSGIGSGRIGG